MSETNDTKWFLQHLGKVQGPFGSDSLQSTLDSMHEAATQAFVWRRGLTEWIKASQWRKNEVQLSPIISTNLDENTHTHASVDNELFEKTFAHTFTEGVFYRVQVNYVDQPLMSKTELMTLIAKQQDVSKVSIQDPQTKDWKEVYAFPDIVERLGLTRRKQPRVPILAQFNGKSNKQADVSYRVITVSQGGMGFTENYDLKIGDEVEGQMSSPHFFQSIHVKADVIYAGQDGYIGLKFSQITEESQSAIIEYIKKFGKNTSQIP